MNEFDLLFQDNENNTEQTIELEQHFYAHSTNYRNLFEAQFYKFQKGDKLEESVDGNKILDSAIKQLVNSLRV